MDFDAKTFRQESQCKAAKECIPLDYQNQILNNIVGLFIRKKAAKRILMRYFRILINHIKYLTRALI